MYETIVQRKQIPQLIRVIHCDLVTNKKPISYWPYLNFFAYAQPSVYLLNNKIFLSREWSVIVMHSPRMTRWSTALLHVYATRLANHTSRVIEFHAALHWNIHHTLRGQPCCVRKAAVHTKTELNCIPKDLQTVLLSFNTKDKDKDRLVTEESITGKPVFNWTLTYTTDFILSVYNARLQPCWRLRCYALKLKFSYANKNSATLRTKRQILTCSPEILNIKLVTWAENLEK